MGFGASPATGELGVDEGLSAPCDTPRLDLSLIYSTCFVDVCRWLRALGGPEDELEDMAQEVFLVVRDRLDSFDGGNLRGWLYRIARNVARNHRRRRFFRQLFSRRYADSLATPPRDRQSPERRLDEEKARRIAGQALARMGEKKRVAFVLFELEGYSSDEIARLEGVPEATVRTRLFHARRQFRELVRRLAPPERGE